MDSLVLGNTIPSSVLTGNVGYLTGSKSSRREKTFVNHLLLIFFIWMLYQTKHYAVIGIDIKFIAHKVLIRNIKKPKHCVVSF